tara:strand:+ start:475 stop:1419 length:945 start_codon:yes stop_codon:yes gene_type:complete
MKILSLLLLFSCSNILVPDLNLFNSVFLDGQAWIEIKDNYDCENGLRVFDNEFSLEIYFSGSSDRANAGTIFSLIGKNTENYNDLNCNGIFEPDLGEIDSDGSEELDETLGNEDFIVLAMTNEPSDSSLLTIYINDIATDIDETIDTLLGSVNFLDPSKFYFLQVLSDGDSLTIFLNNNNIFKDKADLMIQGASLMIGAKANSSHAENIWNGYIDEVRLWDNELTEEIREMHYFYPNKLSSSLQDNTICNLRGVWTFNYSEPQYNIVDEKCSFIENMYYNPCYNYSCDSLALDATLWTLPGSEVIFSTSGFKQP